MSLLLVWSFDLKFDKHCKLNVLLKQIDARRALIIYKDNSFKSSYFCIIHDEAKLEIMGNTNSSLEFKSIRTRVYGNVENLRQCWKFQQNRRIKRNKQWMIFFSITRSREEINQSSSKVKLKEVWNDQNHWVLHM